MDIQDYDEKDSEIQKKKEFMTIFLNPPKELFQRITTQRKERERGKHRVDVCRRVTSG
jgi:hypothetical protein